MSELTDKEWLNQLAEDLDRQARMGVVTDAPEGVRYIQMSDTLAKHLAARLREIAGRIPESAGCIGILSDGSIITESPEHGFVQTRAEAEAITAAAMKKSL